ncbi:MAG: twin-arginine translocase subunit TatC [Actinobacteria bacterium]|nr:twin-arginine translocase subunit TatC [Actinomycetota bacterium]NDF83496.1 twin-arginine translocase subunit TatC [Actinomycetota bacterium]NDF87489.1 twin-arginine translocase subunit TatC [Actinomycetota bacterium]HBQ51845.1 twin-arginine translocase subunit TatC [Acidimicrobium sp.]
MAFRSSKSNSTTMSLGEHLGELRMRLIRSIIAVALGASAILAFYDPVLQFLTRPYRQLCKDRPDFNCDGSLFALGPLDGLAARMRIAGYGGLIVALPVILWQLWRFIVPALNKKEKQYTIPFIVSSVVLFATGGALAYWTLSKALEFLISWSGTEVNQAFQITKYVSLVILMILAFGVGFLTPLLIVFLQLVGVVTPKTLIKQWRIAIVAIFFVAAVITPSGDPITLMALGLPLTFLYFVAILIGFIAIRKRARRDE